MGRGGNACFHTFQLDHHGPTDQPTDRPTDGRTDKASYRVASPRLKKQQKMSFLVACDATLYPALSVRRLVGWSLFYFFGIFGLTAPAQMP